MRAALNAGIAERVTELERAVPAGAAAGDRRPERQMAMLDSERS